MSLAAFSVLVVAFLLMTGEASVIPSIKRSPASSPASSPSSSSFDTNPPFPISANLLAGTIHNTVQENAHDIEMEIQCVHVGGVEENRSSEGPREWSQRALAEWCYGDDDGDGGIFDEERGLRDGEKKAELQLRSMICNLQEPSMSQFGSLNKEGSRRMRVGYRGVEME